MAEVSHSFELLLVKYLRERKPKKILEWGPGYSTQIMRKECPGAKIISFENKKEWYEIWASKFIKEKTHIDLRFKRGRSYYYPKLEERFDLIFIDGRYRVECLITAYHYLEKDRVVFLHDSRRHAYDRGVGIWEVKEKGDNTVVLVKPKVSKE